MTRTESTPATSMPASGLIARLADLAYRGRGRTVLAWIALTAAVVARGELSGEQYRERLDELRMTG